MLRNAIGEVVGGSRDVMNQSFIFGFMKLIIACYFLVFLFEIFKNFEEALYERIQR